VRAGARSNQSQLAPQRRGGHLTASRSRIVAAFGQGRGALVIHAGQGRARSRSNGYVGVRAFTQDPGLTWAEWSSMCPEIAGMGSARITGIPTTIKGR